MRTPTLSVIIPTYNSERTLAACLASLRDQNYPWDKIELIIADGGSIDSTLEIARSFGVRVISNPLRTGEAGKSVGASAAKHDILAFIDSDNVLPSPHWLAKMVAPFGEERISGAEPLYYSYRREDPVVTRYCSLVGMNDIICLFIGNYDRFCYLTDRWTGFEVSTTDRGDYIIVSLDGSRIPTLGANGFLLRRNTLNKVESKPYLVDIDVIYQLIGVGFNEFAKVKEGIVHLFANDTAGFFRKTRRRVSDYVHYRGQGVRRYPWTSIGQLGILKFIFSTLFVPVLLMHVARGYRKQPDRAWFFHVAACWITLLTYGSFFLIGSMQHILWANTESRRV